MQNVVKRNYLFFVLELLKSETSFNGRHLTSEEISNSLFKKYGVKPNRKTIFNAIADLKQIGFDVALSKKVENRGYFLRKRHLSVAEFFLLIDGIESLDNVNTDYKTDLYEKLCKITGYPYSKIDNFIYGKKNELNEDVDLNDDIFDLKAKIKTKLELISNAIENKKQIVMYCPFGLGNYLIDEISKEDKELLSGSVNPCQLFRNADNELCVSFFTQINKKSSLYYSNYFYCFILIWINIY